jgi:hypothetical protein
MLNAEYGMRGYGMWDTDSAFHIPHSEMEGGE